VTLEYAYWDYEEEEEIMCSTTILASDISRVRKRGDEIRGVDEDEEEFRVVLEPLPPPRSFDDNQSTMGPWHSKSVLASIEKKRRENTALSDEEYLWLARAMVLWATELDWEDGSRSGLAVAMAEWLNADFYLDRDGVFDAESFVGNFEALRECPEEGWETLAIMCNEEMYEPSEKGPGWAEDLSNKVALHSEGENSVKLHSAFGVLLESLTAIAKDLHLCCHPDTGYAMRTKIVG
jgi:hypothetical protein